MLFRSDAEHDARRISIENLRFNGRPVTSAEAAHLKVNNYAEAVRFVGSGGKR